MKHLLEARKLYILVGLPGSGKSTLLKNIPDTMVVSADKVREQMFGIKHEYRDGVRREYLYGWDKQPELFFSIVNSIIEERMKEQLTTFLDTTALTEADRAQAVELARKHGMEAEILMMDVPYETILERNKNRLRYVPEIAYTEMNANFEKTTQFPHRIINDGDSIELSVPSIDFDRLDVIGDVHGLYDEFIKLISKKGYSLDERGVPVHPDNRKLVFLGDVVDRGRKSIDMLLLIERAAKAGHYFIPGNHEDKVAKTWDVLKKTGELQTRSRSSAETLNELLKQDDLTQQRLVNFIKAQKAYLVVNSNNIPFAMAHANISAFDPLSVPKSFLLYGDQSAGPRDSDSDYQEGYANGLNKYHYIRGHIPQTSEQSKVRSLEFEQAFDGYLTLLSLDSYSLDLSNGLDEKDAFEKNVIMEKCDYNYNSVMREQFALINELGKLQEDKLVNAAVEKQTGLSLYKYDRKVFFNNMWDTHPLLLKARGLVLDVAGNIVQHPFDKIFNYGENATGLDLPNDTKVEAIEKLNGFLGCITKHPYKNDLLITTTGSFDSKYVEYIRSLITPEMRGRLIKHLISNDETLMFEVIHPEDNEHPIQYKPEDQGLWLIGARGKNFDDKLKSEDYLDDLGMTVGLKRPARYETTLGDVREWAKTSELEGFIVRLANGDGDPITKLKTVHYLTTKMIGRLSVNNIKFMYNNPEQFKLRLDEEYQDIVDYIVKTVPKDDFMQYTNMQKMEFMRDCIQKMRTEGELKAQHLEVDTGLGM